MDFDVMDIPADVAILFVVLGVCLQVLFWFPVLSDDLGIIAFFASLPFFGIAGWRLAAALRERFSTGDDHGYMYGQLSQLEGRLTNVEKSLANFQRKVSDELSALKPEVSDTCHVHIEEESRPTKEELEKLKASLRLQGSLQYKGRTIYHALYDKEAKKHRWIRLGTWVELKEKLQEEKSSN